jgi:hypothetical protein
VKLERRPDSAASAAVALWGEYVAATPSLFRRLALLASLRDASTARYSHYRLKPLLGEEATDRFLREQHLETFAKWLGLTLEKQRLDFECFLSTTEGHRRQILVMCAVLTPHDWYAPQEVPEHELRLFLADLAALLEPLYQEYGVRAGERDPEASMDSLTDYCALW